MDHSTMDMGSSSCKIDMMFNTHTIDACFLTEQWHITNNGMFAATCIGVMLLVVVLEFSRRLGKEYDDFLARQFRRHAAEASARRLDLMAGDKKSGVVCCNPQGDSGSRSYSITFRASPLQQLIRAVLHAVTFGLAYIVMLIAMYYNVIILVMIIIGAGIGKFLCDWMTRTIVVDDVGIAGVPAGAGAAAAAAGLASDQASKNGVEEPSVCCG